MSDTCTSCGRPFVGHLGIIATCADLTRLRADAEELAGALEDMRDMANVLRMDGDNCTTSCTEQNCKFEKARAVLSRYREGRK